MFLYLGVSGCPLHLYTPYIHIPPRVYIPPHVPILLCASVCSQRHLHVVGSCKGPFTCWTPPSHLPLYGGASPLFYTPTHLSASLCISMFWGYLYVIWGYFPYVGGLGVFPHLLGVLGHLHMGCPYAHSCTSFVVHYVVCFYYGYDYYSSSYGGIF